MNLLANGSQESENKCIKLIFLRMGFWKLNTVESKLQQKILWCNLKIIKKAEKWHILWLFHVHNNKIHKYTHNIVDMVLIFKMPPVCNLVHIFLGVMKIKNKMGLGNPLWGVSKLHWTSTSQVRLKRVLGSLGRVKVLSVTLKLRPAVGHIHVPVTGKWTCETEPNYLLNQKPVSVQ